MFLLQGSVMGELVKGLSASSLRQRVVAHNLANFNTPGFKRSSVSFEEQFCRAREQSKTGLRSTHPDHFPETCREVVPEVKQDRYTTRRLDGNNVDLETEMIDLVTNQLRYNAYVQQINTRFNQWRYVINEGRR